MFAILESGGKQFRIEEGQFIQVEKLRAEPGDELVLDTVLLVNDGSDTKVGQPYVDNAKVTCEVLDHGRGDKVIVFKKWRRNDSQKKQGHRQDYTTLKIKAIQA
jgi:large subunit ribosomal protein L21